MRLSTGGRWVVVTSLLVTSLLYGCKQLGGFEPAELFVFDRIVRQLPDQPADPRLLVVGVTEEDIQQYGWPLSDEVLARLLAQLQQHQPKVVGLDLYRSSFRPPGQAELRTQLQAANLVAIMNVGSDPVLGEVPPPPNVPLERVGFNDFPIDPDGVIRRNLLFVKTSERDYYSYALRLILAYTGNSEGAFKAEPDKLSINGVILPALLRQQGGYERIDDRGYQILLRYRNASVPAQQFSVSQVLSGRFDPTSVRGRIVLIGTTAASLKDQFYTPYSSQLAQEFTMPGVVVHAQMLSQLLDGVVGPAPAEQARVGQPAFYRFMPTWAEIFWLGGWCLLGGGAAWLVQRPLQLLLVGGLLLAGLAGLGGAALAQLVWLPLAEPAVGFLGTGAAVMACKLLYRSTYDPLTDLLNREGFIAQLNRALRLSRERRDPTPDIVVFLDIDRFKVINESLGHSAGDQVLVTLAQRLKQHNPPAGLLARVGGDEFALLLQGMDREAAGAFLNQFQLHLTEPLIVSEQRFSSTVSMGIAVTQAGYDHKAADLLRDAHTAMYRAKALGKTRYEVFAAGMLTEAVTRLRLESDLLNALEKHEFLLYYQPIIQLSTGRIAGFEALVRWQQQDRGFVLPSAFIPVAEETGLIMPLGQWIFRQACEQLCHWRHRFPDLPWLSMSINLSNRQFGQPNLVDQVEAILQETGVPGEHVRIEITESMVMGDVEAAIDLMLRLKALDLKLGIDDFGTGYSSLSYLHRFPMDTLKVDKSFVGRMEDSPEDREIVQTIVALGHKLGMEVVAEGIEAADHISLLREMHCEYGQGYFFSKPLSQAAATDLLAQSLTASAIW